MVASRAEVARLRQRFESEPRFAIENLFKIRDRLTRKMIRLAYNEAQVKLQYEIDVFRKAGRPVRLWICKSRRAGMSTVCEANLYHDTIFTPGTRSLIVANQQKPAENILEMCSLFWANSPNEFKPPLPPEFRGKPPRDRLIFDGIDSEILTATSESLDQYLGFGIDNVHATEVSRWKRGEELMTAIYPTLQGTKSMFFGESTPRGQGNFFHAQCMLAAESMGRHGGQHGGFRLLFVPWHELRKSYATDFLDGEGLYDDDARRAMQRTLTDAERKLIERFSVSFEQLNWRRGQLAGPPFNGDEELFDQEYPTDLETAFLSSGTTVVSRDTLKWLADNKRPPEWEGDIYFGESSAANVHISDHDLVRRPTLLTEGAARSRINGAERFKCSNNDGNYRPLRIWRRPRAGDRLAVCCDVGGGNPDTRGGGDYSTIALIAHNVFGPTEVIATWKGHIRPVDFAVLTAAFSWWARRLVGDASPPLLAAEWNGTGVPMNMHLDSKQLYQPLFRYFAPGVRGAPATNHIGWESNGKTKPMGVGFMQDMLEKRDIDVPDDRMTIELAAFKSFTGSDGGEDFGGEGAHDDMVTPLLIGCSLIRLGKLGGNPMPIIARPDRAPSGYDDSAPFSREDERVQVGAASGGMYAGGDDDEFDYGERSSMDWE